MKQLYLPIVAVISLILPKYGCSQTETKILIESFDSTNTADFLHKNKTWATMHTLTWVDLNGNGREDAFESFKDVTIVSDPVNGNKNKVLSVRLNRLSGDTFFRFRNKKTLLNQMRRAEIATLIGGEKKVQLISPHNKYLFSFDILIPTDSFEFEKNKLASRDIVAQWHDVGIESDSPPLSVQIRGNRWYLAVNRVGDKEHMDYIDLGEVQQNKWVSWKFEVIFSPSSDGELKVFKNKLQIYSDNQPNLPRDTYQYFKVGIYKPDWWRKPTTTISRKIYYDNISMFEVR